MSPAPNAQTPGKPEVPGNPPQRPEKSGAFRNIIAEQRGRMNVLDQDRKGLRSQRDELRAKVTEAQSDIGKMTAVVESVQNAINAYSVDDINEAVTQFVRDVNEAILTLREKAVALEDDIRTANTGIEQLDTRGAQMDEEYAAYEQMLTAVGEQP